MCSMPVQCCNSYFNNHYYSDHKIIKPSSFTARIIYIFCFGILLYCGYYYKHEIPSSYIASYLHVDYYIYTCLVSADT